MDKGFIGGTLLSATWRLKQLNIPWLLELLFYSHSIDGPTAPLQWKKTTNLLRHQHRQTFHFLLSIPSYTACIPMKWSSGAWVPLESKLIHRLCCSVSYSWVMTYESPEIDVLLMHRGLSISKKKIYHVT